MAVRPMKQLWLIVLTTTLLLLTAGFSLGLKSMPRSVEQKAPSPASSGNHQAPPATLLAAPPEGSFQMPR